MKVWMVSKPQASPELMMEGINSAEDLVAYCARVSNPSNQYNTETSDKLIKYLIKHSHWSPLEMVSVTLGVETTRDIARQFLRHRSFTFQEFSQRYSEPDQLEGDAFVIREARLQHPTNRQASVDNDDMVLEKQWAAKQSMLIHEAKLAYRWAIAKGIAKEQARVVLPEGNTVSRLFVQGTIRSFIHYVQTRTEEGTQKEHRELAKAIADTVSTVFPMASDFKQ